MLPRTRTWLLPAVAAGCALGYLACVWAPVLTLAVLVSSVMATCGLVLRRRRSRALLLVLTGIAAWLTVALAGAWMLRDRRVEGPLWLLAALFALPLPVIPWLYWVTYREDDAASVHAGEPKRDEGGGQTEKGAKVASCSPLCPHPSPHSSRSPHPGHRTPGPNRAGSP